MVDYALSCHDTIQETGAKKEVAAFALSSMVQLHNRLKCGFAVQSSPCGRQSIRLRAPCIQVWYGCIVAQQCFQKSLALYDHWHRRGCVQVHNILGTYAPCHRHWKEQGMKRGREPCNHCSMDVDHKVDNGLYLPPPCNHCSMDVDHKIDNGLYLPPPCNHW
jgi:hypothetical protein